MDYMLDPPEDEEIYVDTDESDDYYDDSWDAGDWHFGDYRSDEYERTINQNY